MLRRILIAWAILPLVLLQGSAIADPPVNNSPEKGIPIKLSQRVNFFGVCFGRSDFPHLSSHVPGTVNAQAYTYCPGQWVTVNSTLTRTYAGGETMITRSKKGLGRATVNLAFKCLWKPGQPRIQYALRSTHKLSDGSTGETERKEKLQC
jgi:hypothetical protein